MVSKFSPRVFADTNVLFSAFYGSPNCQKIFQAHLQGKISLVVSQKVLSELVKNIQKKLPIALTRLQSLLLDVPVKITPNPSKIPLPVSECVDTKDQTIFAAALSAKVKVFITGNIRDFQKDKLQKLFSVRILTPAEAVKILKL